MLGNLIIVDEFYYTMYNISYMDQNNAIAVPKTKLLSEWDFEANNKLGLNPDVLFTNSTKKAYWVCKDCGHKWKTQISVRKKGHGCPRCAHLKTGKNNASLKEPNRSLLKVFPDVVKVWNYEKNQNLKPEDLAAGSNKKVWWKCSRCGREWQTTIYAKAKSGTTTCKECTFKQLDRSYYVKPGINDLASCNERVSAEWDYEKNGELKPENVPVRSITKVWWKCNKGHTWQASVLSRTKEGYRGCPICANKLIVAGINDLATTRPDLAKNWNYEKNGDLKPSDIAAGSNRKVWWKCEKGHEWKTMPNCCGFCPYCINQKVWPGYNDLATINPKLSSEWNYEKNGEKKPENTLYGSGKKVWWRCSECAHEWQATVVSRANGSGCPVCVNKVVITGHNDLTTINPELAKEWNYERNGNLKPENIIAGSPKKVWWKCKLGHEWQATVESRHHQNVHCPICSSNRRTSIPEKAVGYYLEKYGIAVEENKRVKGYELDIFIPSMSTAIEYDGQYYHNSKEKDLRKNRLCKKLGIQLIRIREPKLPPLKSTSTDIKIKKLSHNYSYLNEPIKQVLLIVIGDKKFDINVDRDYGNIYARYQKGEEEKSLIKTHNELIKEWDYYKNTVDPAILNAGSKYKAWWKCSECGYEWQAPVYSRALGGYGCRKCGHKRSAKLRSVVTDIKDSLSAKNPDLAKEWNYTKNGDLKPEQVYAKSPKKVWWICEKGHEWEASIANRATGRGCPVCSNRIVLLGYNDLATVNPGLAKEWNYEKNKGLRPEQVLAVSSKYAWWKCPKCGKEWQARIRERNLRKIARGCRNCSAKYHNNLKG